MRLSEPSHREITVSRQAPRETEKCKFAAWRMWNLPSREKCRGAARGGSSGLLGMHLTDKSFVNDVRLTPRQKVMQKICRLFLIFGVV